MNKIGIIGAGPAGLMTAILAKKKTTKYTYLREILKLVKN